MYFILRHPLNRDRKLAALIRYFRWQLGSRLIAHPIPMPFANGTRLWGSPGLTGATGNIYCGLHEFADMAFAGHLLRPGDLFADVGANIGSYSILAASTGAHVASFEPSSAACFWLKQNVQINGFEQRIKIYKQAVSAKVGIVTVSSDLDTANHIVEELYSQENGEQVDSITLDGAFASACPTLVKIDVEGYEEPVIAGATAILNNTDLLALIVELNGSGQRYGFHEPNLVSRILSAGFECRTYDPFRRTLTPADPETTSIGNKLFVRNHESIGRRLAEAPPLRVLGRAV